MCINVRTKRIEDQEERFKEIINLKISDVRVKNDSLNENILERECRNQEGSAGSKFKNPDSTTI